MKLHPDGTVEGTPKECAEFKRLQHKETHSKPFKEDYLIRTPLVGFIQYSDTAEQDS